MYAPYNLKTGVTEVLIAVFDGREGGTRRTVEDAMQRGLEIVYIDVE